MIGVSYSRCLSLVWRSGRSLELRVVQSYGGYHVPLRGSALSTGYCGWLSHVVGSSSGEQSGMK